jgi:nanoRNase/pAp phosphatase (c-di-AMP/oligoRNAs hydrolase)
MDSKLTAERYPELVRAVEEMSPAAQWLVLTHDSPDPDALASAALLAQLLHEGFGQPVTAAYGGIIGRAENREMVKTLKLSFVPLRELSLERFSRFALVDTQPRTGNNQLPDAVAPDLVFDHHPVRRDLRLARFADVRPEYGATASILAEYVHAAGLEVTSACATAVVYAIRAETQDFGREFGGPDRVVYDRLLPRVDKRALGRIQRAPVPFSYYRSLHQALENLYGVENLVISHLDEVEQPDIIPEIADLLLRMEGKTWTLCTGRFHGRVYLSIRTSNPRAEAGQMMRKLVGRHGKGGGHGRTAGGWVTIQPAYLAQPGALQAQLAGRFARALGKDPGRISPLVLEVSRELSTGS